MVINTLKLGVSGVNLGKSSKSEKLDFNVIRSEFIELRRIGGEVDELIFTDCVLGEELPENLVQRGLKIYPSIEEMKRIGEIAAEESIKVGGHASFLVNFASLNRKIRSTSRGHITALCKRMEIAGGIYAVTHLGFLKNKSEDELRDEIACEIEKIVNKTKVQLLIENAGKRKGLGSLQLIIYLAEKTGVKICLDWAHLHAYNRGSIQNEEDIRRVIYEIERKLGRFEEWVPVMHISGIKYGYGGELEHRGLNESDLPWIEVIKVLNELGVNSIIICESPRRWCGDLELLRKAMLGEKVEIKKFGQRSILDWIKKQ